MSSRGVVLELSTTWCPFCQKRPATRLCDAPIGKSHYIGHPPRSEMMKAKNGDIAFKTVHMEETITCDRLICDECATRIAHEIDYCPDCIERIKTTKKGSKQ